MLGLTNVKGTEQEFKVTNGHLEEYKAHSGEIKPNNFVEITQKVIETPTITLTDQIYNNLDNSDILNKSYFCYSDGSRYSYQDLFAINPNISILPSIISVFMKYDENKYYCTICLNIYELGVKTEDYYGILLVNYSSTGLEVIRTIVFPFADAYASEADISFLFKGSAVLYKSNTSLYLPTCMMTYNSNGEFMPIIFIINYNPQADTFYTVSTESLGFLNPTVTSTTNSLTLEVSSFGSLMFVAVCPVDHSNPDGAAATKFWIFDTSTNQMVGLYDTSGPRIIAGVEDFISAGNNQLTQDAYYFTTEIPALNINRAGYYCYNSSQRSFSLVNTNDNNISVAIRRSISQYETPAKICGDPQGTYYICGKTDFITGNNLYRIEIPQSYYLNSECSGFYDDEFILFCTYNNNSSSSYKFYVARYKIINGDSVTVEKIAEKYFSLGDWYFGCYNVYGKVSAIYTPYVTAYKCCYLLRDSITSQETVIKKVDNSNSEILGITATTCKENEPGDVWVLNA